MDNPVIIALASFFPLVIAVVKQSTWSPQTNAAIALVGYIACGLIGTALSGTAFTLENITPIITQTTVIGTIAYQLIWKNLGKTSDEAPSVEEQIVDATSPGAG